MFSKFGILILSLTVVSLVGAIAHATGTDVQNGGGGVVKDGHYMTFASAQIPIKDQPEQAADIPGMKLLIGQISALKFTSFAKNTLLNTIYPVQERSYYKVDASHYDETVRAKIISNYKKLMSLDPNDNIVLFAVTDVKTHTTFLLPEFYQLKEVEQAAILLHESSWIFDPAQSYNHIVALEMSAQAYFEQPQNAQLTFNFYRNLSVAMNQPMALIYAMIKIQYPTGGRVHAVSVLGEDFWECTLIPFTNIDINYETKVAHANCALNLASYLMPQIMNSPSSNFIQMALLQGYGYTQGDPDAHNRNILFQWGNMGWEDFSAVSNLQEFQTYLQVVDIDMYPIELPDGTFIVQVYSGNQDDSRFPGRLLFQ